MDNTVVVSESSTTTKRSSNKTQGKYKSSSTATKSTGSAPLHANLKLLVCHLSGKDSTNIVSVLQPKRSCCVHGDQEPENNITPT